MTNSKPFKSFFKIFYFFAGWAGSSPKHVQKYTQLYASEFGIGAHGYILPMEHTFSYDQKKISEISYFQTMAHGYTSNPGHRLFL